MSDWFSGLFTILALLGFLGVVAWAYSPSQRSEFERAAQLPLEGDEPRGTDPERLP